jgi:hypothetical protein
MPRSTLFSSSSGDCGDQRRQWRLSADLPWLEGTRDIRVGVDEHVAGALQRFIQEHFHTTFGHRSFSRCPLKISSNKWCVVFARLEMSLFRPETEPRPKSAVNRNSLTEFNESTHVMNMEHSIACEHKKIVRDKLKECVLQNFENANENCYDLRVQYVTLLKDRYGGMLFPRGLEPKNRLNPAICVEREDKK